MIQIQPYAIPSDSNSALAATPALQGFGAKGFAAFLGEGMAGEALLPGTGKTPIQTGVFPAQQGASQALMLLSGAAPTSPPETVQGPTQQPQMAGAVADFAAANNSSLDAALQNPDMTTPGPMDLTETRGELELQTADLPRAMPAAEAIVAGIPAKMQTGPAIKHSRIAQADASNADCPDSDELLRELSAEPLPATGDLLRLTEADEKPDGPEEPNGDPSFPNAEAQLGRPEVFTGQEVPLAATPEPQASRVTLAPDERSGVEIASADARPDARPRADDHRGPKAVEPMPAGRHSASEQAALPQASGDRSAAPTDGNLGVAAMGPSEVGLRPSVANRSTPAEAKTPVAHPSRPDVISGRPGEIGQQLGVEIARHTAEGRDNLIIRLDPAELGRIHIRMHFDDAGQLRAQVSAESGAALDMLRRDSSDLNRALNDAGVRTDAQSFQFEGRGQQREQPAPRNQPDLARSARDGAGDNEPVTETTQRKLNPNGALDLFA